MTESITEKLRRLDAEAWPQPWRFSPQKGTSCSYITQDLGPYNHPYIGQFLSGNNEDGYYDKKGELTSDYTEFLGEQIVRFLERAA